MPQEPACKHQNQHVGRLYALIIQSHCCGALHHHGKPSVPVRRHAPESCGKDSLRITARLCGIPKLQHRVRHRRAITVQNPAADLDRSGRVQRERRSSLEQVFKPDAEVGPDRL